MNCISKAFNIIGMNLTLVNLGYNKLKKMPSAALRNTRVIGHLILDGNIFTKLETGAIHNVNVVRISVSLLDLSLSGLTI